LQSGILPLLIVALNIDIIELSTPASSAGRFSSRPSITVVSFLAAQTLRNLATGQAYINYVASAGMMSALLTVPRISEHPLSQAAFAALRERLLSESAAAIPIAEAIRLVEQRERHLLALRKTAVAEPEPQTFRTRAPTQAAVGRGHSRPDAASRAQARASTNTTVRRAR
jgi:hypothetical protein